MSADAAQYWFVERFPDGTVSHLVRITDTGTALSGEYFRDGAWRADGSVVRYLNDRGLADEIDPAEGTALAARLGIAAGFANYFADFGLELPEPIPAVGLVDHDDWTVRYKLADKGRRLDFLALNRNVIPIHGEVHADGNVVIHATYVDHYTVGPDATADDEARAEAEMEAHNRRVTEELERKGLA